MTDNNADDADGQNSKLSRRTALALMGTSAVGGAAATGAFSQLTADRPIDIQVDSTGDVEAGDSGSSELQITNNTGDGTTIDAEISTSDSDVSFISQNGTSSATFDETASPWELTGLQDGETAVLEFGYPSESAVTLTVTAFSSTNGFSIISDQSVTLTSPPAVIASDATAWYDAEQISGVSDGGTVSTWSDQSGNGYDLTEAVDDANAPTYAGSVSGVNNLGAVEMNVRNSSEYLGNKSIPNTSDTREVMAVVIEDAGGHSMWASYGATNTYRLWPNAGSNSDKWAAYNGKALEIPNSATLRDSPAIVTASYNDANSFVDVNGSNSNTGDAGSNNNDGMLLGRRGDLEAIFYSAYFCEVIVWDGTLSSTERDEARRYLNNKWNVY